jgi:hypothetical protein
MSAGTRGRWIQMSGACQPVVASRSISTDLENFRRSCPKRRSFGLGSCERTAAVSRSSCLAIFQILMLACTSHNAILVYFPIDSRIYLAGLELLCLNKARIMY